MHSVVFVPDLCANCGLLEFHLLEIDRALNVDLTSVTTFQSQLIAPLRNCIYIFYINLLVYLFTHSLDNNRSFNKSKLSTECPKVRLESLFRMDPDDAMSSAWLNAQLSAYGPSHPLFQNSSNGLCPIARSTWLTLMPVQSIHREVLGRVRFDWNNQRNASCDGREGPVAVRGCNVIIAFHLWPVINANRIEYSLRVRRTSGHVTLVLGDTRCAMLSCLVEYWKWIIVREGTNENRGVGYSRIVKCT